ncbi:hypothetical protein LJC71_06860 [Desulfosarcina sp. OttesenSCG-928-A07]|nr:hypothetical protein [Desulfosarcina sp. OttesenSCG-928-A07]
MPDQRRRIAPAPSWRQETEEEYRGDKNSARYLKDHEVLLGLFVTFSIVYALVMLYSQVKTIFRKFGKEKMMNRLRLDLPYFIEIVRSRLLRALAWKNKTK